MENTSLKKQFNTSHLVLFLSLLLRADHANHSTNGMHDFPIFSVRNPFCSVADFFQHVYHFFINAGVSVKWQRGEQHVAHWLRWGYV